MDPAQLARFGTAVGRPIQRLHLRSLRDPNPDSPPTAGHRRRQAPARPDDEIFHTTSPQRPLHGLSSGAEALAVERRLRAGQSPAGRPHLNPLWAPGWVATLWSRHLCTTIGKLRVGFLSLAPFGPCPRCKGTGHIKRGPRRRPVCPRCKGQRRIQRRGSRTVHRAARKIRDGRRAAARYQQEDRDGTP